MKRIDSSITKELNTWLTNYRYDNSDALSHTTYEVCMNDLDKPIYRQTRLISSLISNQLNINITNQLNINILNIDFDAID